MKLFLNNLSLFIILYCSALFPLAQPFLIPLLGDGATTLTSVALLGVMLGLFMLRAALDGRLVINTRYLWAYAGAIFGVAVNYVAWLGAIQHPEKYYAAIIFIAVSAIISCKDFGQNPKLPGWVALLVSVYFLADTLHQVMTTNLGDTVRVSLYDDVVSNLNYLPVACFLLAAHFVATGRRTALLISVVTVVLLLLLTQSRSAFLAVLGAIVFFYMKQRRLSLAGMVRMVGTLAITYLLLNFGGLMARFTLEGSTSFIAESGRVLIFLDLFDRFLASPFFGAGFGVDDHIRYDPHSMFAELLLQGGVIGFVSIAPIVIFGIRAANRSFGQSPLGTFAALGTVCLTIAGQFTGSLLLSLALWIFIGLCLSVEKMQRPDGN